MCVIWGIYTTDVSTQLSIQLSAVILNTIVNPNVDHQVLIASLYVLCLRYTCIQGLWFFCHSDFESKSQENWCCRVNVCEYESHSCLYQGVFIIMTLWGFPQHRQHGPRVEILGNITRFWVRINKFCPIRTKPRLEIDNMAWNKHTSKVEALYYAGNMRNFPCIHLSNFSLTARGV